MSEKVGNEEIVLHETGLPCTKSYVVACFVVRHWLQGKLIYSKGVAEGLNQGFYGIGCNNSNIARFC